MSAAAYFDFVRKGEKKYLRIIFSTLRAAQKKQVITIQLVRKSSKGALLAQARVALSLLWTIWADWRWLGDGRAGAPLDDNMIALIAPGKELPNFPWSDHTLRLLFRYHAFLKCRNLSHSMLPLAIAAMNEVLRRDGSSCPGLMRAWCSSFTALVWQSTIVPSKLISPHKI